jgi:tetratricopeptide (TPR) repeat protein
MRRSTGHASGHRLIAGFRAMAGMLGAAIMGLALTTTGAFADPVKVRAWAHPGFGRIVFNWPAPVTYETGQSGVALSIKFNRNIEAVYSAVEKSLGDYIARTTTGGGGTTTIFTLKPGVAMRQATSSGNAVIVDLVKGASAAAVAPAARPATPAAKPVAAPGTTTSPSSGKLVGVRVGTHENYSRVVFDWTRNVQYQVDQKSGTATIRFARPERVDIDRLKRRLPPRILTVKYQTNPADSTVELGISSGSRVRHFRSGTKIVVDILGGSAVQAATPTPTPEPKPEPAKAAKADGPKTLVPPAAKKPPVNIAAEPKSNAKPVTIKTLPKKPETSASKNLTVLKVNFAPLEGGARISFSWLEPTAAAIFSRAGHIWAVFDRSAKLQMTPPSASLSEVIFLAEQIDIENLTVFRFRVAPKLVPVARRQGHRWAIELRSNIINPPRLVSIDRKGDIEKDGSVVLSGAVANKLTQVPDPEVGDIIQVAPILTPGVGIPHERDFVQFKLLQSAQGVAIVAKVDDLKIATKRKGLEISAAGGLAISQGRRRVKNLLNRNAKKGDGKGDEGPAARLFQFAAWKGDQKASFEKRKQALQLGLSKVPKGRRNKARWPLARFYFAHQYMADATGVMSQILTHDPAIIEDPSFKALRGAARLWLGRTQDAEVDLMVPSLDGDPEISIWRSALFAQKHEWKRAYDEYLDAGGIPAKYDQNVRVWLTMQATEAALRANDIETVNKLLIALNKEENLRPLQATQIMLLRGKGFEAVDDIDSAIQNYQEVIAAGVRPTEARANFARINAGLKNRELTLLDAIAEMERLRFSWRGDDFEFELLRRLGDLYMDNGDYRNALNVYRLAVTYFPKLPDSKVVSQEMNDVFKRLFLDGEADALSSISALALYYDFRELTPVGKIGDEMIRQLANRLVSVDLLTRAAGLLEHQVKFRLKSVEKSRVGLRLAVIYMLHRRFDKAMSTMKITRWRNLPPELLMERRQIEARILSNLEKPEDALLALVGDASKEANLIRVDLYWQMRRWQDMIQTLAEILGNAWNGPRALTREERSYVMKMAVAMALDGNETGLDQLRHDYANKMTDTKDAEGFDLITQKIDPRTTEFRKVAGAIAQIDTLESFMSRYRERLYGGKIGETN